MKNLPLYLLFALFPALLIAEDIQPKIDQAEAPAPTPLIPEFTVILPHLDPAALSSGLQAVATQIEANEAEKAKAALTQAKSSVSKKEIDEKYDLCDALIRILQNDFKGAEGAIEAGLDKHPSNSDLRSLLGLVQAKNKDFDKARISVAEAIWFQKSKAVSPAWMNLQHGLILIQLDRRNEAISALEKAHALDPALSAASRSLADVYLAQGREADASRILQSINTADTKNDPTLIAMRAKSLLSKNKRTLDKKEVREAKQLAKSLIDKKSGDDQYRDPAFPIYVSALLANGELDEAGSKLENALKLTPQDLELQRLSKQLALQRESQGRGSTLPK